MRVTAKNEQMAHSLGYGAVEKIYGYVSLTGCASSITPDIAYHR
jgi:hypothetical protein